MPAVVRLRLLIANFPLACAILIILNESGVWSSPSTLKANLHSGQSAHRESVDSVYPAPHAAAVGHDSDRELPDAKRVRKLLADKKNPVIWVFTGDSITHGALHTRGMRSYPEHFAERVRWELGRRRDFVINTGISGDTTAGILADWKHRIGRHQPQVVSVMIGMNDCARKDLTVEEFESQLVELVNRIRDLDAIPILATTNTIRPDPRRQRLPQFNATIKKVTAAKQVLLVDNWSAWEQQSAVSAAFRQQALNDAIHPNGFGHAELARAWFRTLEMFDRKSPTCSQGL